MIPIPKNIYGVTKLAAENLCELFFRKHRLPTVVLRTSRFFPEDDDDAAKRTRFETANAQANELLYRRGDIEDMVSAHVLAETRLRDSEFRRDKGFRRYIISARTPFQRSDCAQLRLNAAAVVQRLFPETEALYRARQWTLFPSIDRVYDSSLAARELGWESRYDFRHVLDCLRNGMDFRSPLAREVGSKGYHSEVFTEGPYPAR